MSTLELAGLILTIELALVAWFVLFILMRRIRRLEAANAGLTAELDAPRAVPAPVAEVALEPVPPTLAVAPVVVAAAVVAATDPDPDPAPEAKAAETIPEADDLNLAFSLDQEESSTQAEPMTHNLDDLDRADDFEEAPRMPEPDAPPAGSAMDEPDGLEDEELADLFDTPDLPPDEPLKLP